MFVATSNKSMQGIYFSIKISVHTSICIFLVLQEIQQKVTQLHSVNSLSMSIADTPPQRMEATWQNQHPLTFFPRFSHKSGFTVALSFSSGKTYHGLAQEEVKIEPSKFKTISLDKKNMDKQR